MYNVECGLLRHVVGRKPDFSEEHTASVFRKQSVSRAICMPLRATLLLGLLFNHEDGRSMFLRNVCEKVPGLYGVIYLKIVLE
jgi:hypothetical protein